MMSMAVVTMLFGAWLLIAALLYIPPPFFYTMARVAIMMMGLAVLYQICCDIFRGAYGR